MIHISSLILLSLCATVILAGPSAFETTILNLHNAARAAAGLPALSYDNRLYNDAVTHTGIMLAQNCFAHQCSGEGGLDRTSVTGWMWLGENIAKQPCDAQTFHNAWMNSPSHRANILSTDANAAGICIRQAPDGFCWGTADFAKLSDAPQPPPAAPPSGPIGVAWQLIGGSLSGISAKGSQVWGWNSGGYVFRWVEGWQNIPGWVSQVSAASDGCAWAVNAYGSIFRFHPSLNSWQNIPGSLSQVDGWSCDSAVGVNSGGLIFQWKNNGWVNLPGGAIWASIGPNEDVWVAGTNRLVYRWNPAIGFQLYPGSNLQRIAVDASGVVCTTVGGGLWRWTGANWVNVVGNAEHLGLANGRYWAVNSANQIFTAIDGGVARAEAPTNEANHSPSFAPWAVGLIIVAAVVVGVALIGVVAVIIVRRNRMRDSSQGVPFIAAEVN